MPPARAPPTFLDTDFARYYVPDVHGERNDHYVYRHANGILVVGLAHTHPAVAMAQRENAEVRVEYHRGEAKGGLGKRKREACVVEFGTKLATVSVTVPGGEQTFTVRSVVRGRLVDTNHRFADRDAAECTNIVANKCLDEGFFAMIQEFAQTYKRHPSEGLASAVAAGDDSASATPATCISRAEAARLGAAGIVPESALDAEAFAAKRRIAAATLQPYRWGLPGRSNPPSE